MTQVQFWEMTIRPETTKVTSSTTFNSDQKMFRRNPWDRRPARKVKKQRKKTPNKGHANLKKEMEGDDILVELTGKTSATRGEYVKLIWKYIKDNKLQKASDGRVIVPDEKLAKLMGVQGHEMNAFLMLRFIERHLKKTD